MSYTSVFQCEIFTGVEFFYFQFTNKTYDGMNYVMLIYSKLVVSSARREDFHRFRRTVLISLREGLLIVSVHVDQFRKGLESISTDRTIQTKIR